MRTTLLIAYHRFGLCALGVLCAILFSGCAANGEGTAWLVVSMPLFALILIVGTALCSGALAMGDRGTEKLGRGIIVLGVLILVGCIA